MTTEAFNKLTEAQKGMVPTETVKKGTEEYERMNTLVRELGRTTEFTATEAATGMAFLAKAGFDLESSLALLPGIVDLATAAEVDLARAADIASDALGAFGLNPVGAGPELLAKNFTRVSNALAKAANRSNFTIETLFESIQAGASAATSAGMPMETYLATMGRLASMSIKGAKPGTAMKTALLGRLADPKIQRLLQAEGIAVKQTSGPLKGEMRDLFDIIDDIRDLSKSSSKLDLAGFLGKLFGLRAVLPMTALVNEGTEGLRRLRQEIETGIKENFVADLAAQLRATRMGEIKALASAWESVTLSTSDANTGGISMVIVGLTRMLRSFDRFLTKFPLVGKLLGIFVALAIAVTLIGLLFVGIAAAVLAIKASMVAMVAIGVALVVAAVAWVASFEPVRTFFSWLWGLLTADDPLSSLFSGWMAALEPVKAVIDSILAWDGGLVNKVLSKFGLGDESEESGSREASEREGVLGAQARAAATISEHREESRATLQIAGAPPGSELKQKGSMRGIGLTLDESGGF
jgi:TP901 family phage tail tape measure protein